MVQFIYSLHESLLLSHNTRMSHLWCYDSTNTTSPCNSMSHYDSSYGMCWNSPELMISYPHDSSNSCETSTLRNQHITEAISNSLPAVKGHASPKTMISSCHIMEGEGGSRRKTEVEVRSLPILTTPPPPPAPRLLFPFPFTLALHTATYYTGHNPHSPTKGCPLLTTWHCMTSAILAKGVALPEVNSHTWTAVVEGLEIVTCYIG
jgi:hypothetical protein